MCVHECSLCMQNVCVCGRARVSIPDLMWTVRFELNMPVLCAYPSPVGSLCRGCFNDDPYGRPLCVTPSRTSCPIKARQLRPLVWPPPPPPDTSMAEVGDPLPLFCPLFSHSPSLHTTQHSSRSLPLFLKLDVICLKLHGLGLSNWVGRVERGAERGERGREGIEVRREESGSSIIREVRHRGSVKSCGASLVTALVGTESE